MKQEQQQQSIQSNKNKIYQCKCGKSYDRNSSLFNHIKLSHQNNKEQFLIAQSKVGRPSGLKDTNPRCPRGQAIQKREIKEIQCKCGDILQGPGAFYNHVNGKHKGDSFYQQKRKKQGRKKTSHHDESFEENDQCVEQLSKKSRESQSEKEKNFQINSNDELKVDVNERSEEENIIPLPQYEELIINDSLVVTIDDKTTYIQNNDLSIEDFDYLNIFNKNNVSDNNESDNHQFKDNFQNFQFSQYTQEFNSTSQCQESL